MKLPATLVLCLTVLLSPAVAVAQSGRTALAGSPSVARLGDIMTSVQLRHIKLWFAGQRKNWALAAYELRQLKAGLGDAATLYPDIPVSNVTTMADPISALAAAIDAKDGRKFVKAYDQLTAGCNACHQSMDRGFIVIQTPTIWPYSNQTFLPAKP